MTKRIIIFILFIFVIGCGGPKIEKFSICPGKAILKDSIAALGQTEKVTPFRASGQCLATVYEENKRRKEEFSIKVWFNPPSELRLFGDIAFNARGLDIGSNADEFWFAAKPKELGNSFMWGKWIEQQGFITGIGPKILLDAFGSIDLKQTGDFSLSNEGPFDVLTLKNQDRIVKKIYIYCCDYRIRKIEYFNDAGKLSIVVELSNYSIELDGSTFASQLLIRLIHEDRKEDSFRILFKTVSAFEYTNEKREAYFRKPANIEGFEHVYQIINGRLIEQN